MIGICDDKGDVHFIHLLSNEELLSLKSGIVKFDLINRRNSIFLNSVIMDIN